MRKPNIKKLQKMVDDWNRFYPPGTKVIVRKDGGQMAETETKSEAWLLGGHTAVVMVKGISGSYDLSRVEPVEDDGGEGK